MTSRKLAAKSHSPDTVQHLTGSRLFYVFHRHHPSLELAPCKVWSTHVGHAYTGWSSSQQPQFTCGQVYEICLTQIVLSVQWTHIPQHLWLCRRPNRQRWPYNRRWIAKRWSAERRSVADFENINLKSSKAIEATNLVIQYIAKMFRNLKVYLQRWHWTGGLKSGQPTFTTFG